MRVWMEASEGRESLPDDGRALFYVLEERLDRNEVLTLYPKDLCAAISAELGIDVNRGKLIEPRKVGALLRRYGFKGGRETNRGIPYNITRADFIERARRVGYPLSKEWT